MEASDSFAFLLGWDPGMDWADYLAGDTPVAHDDPVPERFLVAEVDGQLAGRVSIRFALNGFLARAGGHVGYATVAHFRRQGIATAMLGEAISQLRSEGVDRILVTCDEGNRASASIIESSGGVREDVVETSGGRVGRYWIETTPPPVICHRPFRVVEVTPRTTLSLRQSVLRPHEPLEKLPLADDGAPTTGTFAALMGGGEVVGTVRVAEEVAPAGLAGTGPSWRLRGMATRDDLRGKGLGSHVLARVLAHVGDHGGGLLWCNARLGARGLYRRAGFEEFGGSWVDPEIGPHVVMWRSVAPGPPGLRSRVPRPLRR